MASSKLSWLSLVGAFAICAAVAVPDRAHAQATTSSSVQPNAISEYLPASVKAAPDQRCTLHPPGSPSTGITVFTDADGYARFHAVRPSAGKPAEKLTLSCVDPAGGAASYPVDLTANDTFAHRPLNLASEPGIDRPALTGDPLSYTQAQLSRDGYGLRPDPAAAPAMYAAWLEAATKPGRMLFAKRPDKHSHNTVTTTPGSFWIGSVLTGSAPYDSITATFQVPTAIPGAFGTTSTEAVIWPGLGGFGTNSGLIQAGVLFSTTPTTAAYSTWREYCCADTDTASGAHNDSGAFVPSPGDEILAQAWYCDANGQTNINGGFGCTYLYDFQSGAVYNCTMPKGSPSNPPCSSVKALPLCSVSPSTPHCMTLGNSAEFIVENTSPQLTPPTDQFPPFTPVFAMSGVADSAATGKLTTIDSDPAVTLLTDYPHNPPPILVALTGGATTFKVGAAAPVPAVVTSSDRLPNHIDLFVTGLEGGVYSSFWDANGGWFTWFRLPDPRFGDRFTIPQGSMVTQISRNPNHLDLFVSGRDGAVYSTFWDANGGWTGVWSRLSDPHFGDGFTIPPGSPVTALLRNPNHLDLFVSGRDGAVYSTFWDANGGWTGVWSRLSDPHFGDGFTIPPGSPVTALSPNPNHLDLFVSGWDGAVYSTFWDANGGWTGVWSRLPDPHFGDGFTIPPGSPVMALSRNPNHLDLFVSGWDGAVYSTFWDANGGWTDVWFRLPDPNFGDGFTIPPGSPVTASSRNPSHIDLFVVGRDGGVYSTFWDANGGWTNVWFRLSDPNFGDLFTLPSISTISALSSNPDHVDQFVVGKDGGVYSRFWDANGGWTPHWFRL